MSHAGGNIWKDDFISDPIRRYLAYVSNYLQKKEVEVTRILRVRNYYSYAIKQGTSYLDLIYSKKGLFYLYLILN